MITFKHGDLFDDRAQALVNPVNCAGAMGKGLALEFKKRFPDNFKEYRQACHHGKLQPGRMFVFNTYRPHAHRYIINFPTKRHWRDGSRIEDIESGTAALAQEVRDRRIESVAIPALGAGLGGLPWKKVRAVIEEGMRDLDDVRITVYEPRKPGKIQEEHRPERRRR